MRRNVMCCDECGDHCLTVVTKRRLTGVTMYHYYNRGGSPHFTHLNVTLRPPQPSKSIALTNDISELTPSLPRMVCGGFYGPVWSVLRPERRNALLIPVLKARFMRLLGYWVVRVWQSRAVWAENESHGGLQLLPIKLQTVCSHCVILSLSPSPDHLQSSSALAHSKTGQGRGEAEREGLP